jgi:hypothetical protein
MINEEKFNKDLKEIGDLYEEGKDALNNWEYTGGEAEIHDTLFAVLLRLRNIAAGQLQALHNVHADGNN